MFSCKVITIFTLAFFLIFPCGTLAGEGGRGGFGSQPLDIVYGLEWKTSLSEAMSFAKQKDGPVMAYIGDGINDKKLIDKLNGWPQAQELSKTRMAAVQLSAKDAAGKEIIDNLKFRPPGIAFLDMHGNPMAALPFPETVQPITQAVNAWKTMASNVETFFKDRAARGEKYLATGRLRPAYQELDPLSPFKGPEPLKARASLRKIEEQWLKLLEIGVKMPAGTAQQAIFKGLRKDTDGTSFAATMEKYLKDPSSAVAARNSGGPSSSVASATPAKPTAPAKSLAEVSRAPMVSATPQRDDSSEDAGSVDYGIFRAGNDNLKKAEAILKEGVADYKQAINDGMERGPKRNQLLQSARAKFEQVLTICEEAQKAGGGQNLDKIMEKTSMMMYGALKYQSL